MAKQMSAQEANGRYTDVEAYPKADCSAQVRAEIDRRGEVIRPNNITVEQ
jgi:hypothetical protein